MTRYGWRSGRLLVEFIPFGVVMDNFLFVVKTRNEKDTNLVEAWIKEENLLLVLVQRMNENEIPRKRLMLRGRGVPSMPWGR